MHLGDKAPCGWDIGWVQIDLLHTQICPRCASRGEEGRHHFTSNLNIKYTEYHFCLYHQICFDNSSSTLSPSASCIGLSLIASHRVPTFTSSVPRPLRAYDHETSSTSLLPNLLSSLKAICFAASTVSANPLVVKRLVVVIRFCLYQQHGSIWALSVNRIMSALAI